MRKTIAAVSAMFLIVGVTTGIGMADHKQVKTEFNIKEGVVEPIDKNDPLNRHAVWMRWMDDRLGYNTAPTHDEEPRRAAGESFGDIETDDHNIDKKEDDRFEKVG